MSPYAQSSDAVPPTQHTVPSDSLASTKTLRITELLKIILLQVPVQYLTALRPVARAWNDIILEINHIAPATIGHGDENCTCLVNTQACTHTPHYTHRFPIRGNPAFTHTHFHRTTSKDHNGEEILPNTLRHYRGLKLKSRNDTSELDACANQFITDPPVTLVALGNAGVGGTYMQAMLRVPTGMRVSDLLDVWAKMYYADCGHAGPAMGCPSAWYACTSDIVRITDGAGGRMDGDDVGAEMGMLTIAS